MVGRYQRAILPSLGTELDVIESCEAAACSSGNAERARVDVVNSLWRSSGAMRNDIVADFADEIENVFSVYGVFLDEAKAKDVYRCFACMLICTRMMGRYMLLANM